jgi:flap endonuclease-1
MVWELASNRRIGVDIQCFMYRALSNHLNPVDVIREQLIAFSELGITPIYVFDGPPPPEKELVVAKRRDDRRVAAAKIADLRYKMIGSDPEEFRRLENEIILLESAHPQLTYEMKDEIKQIFDEQGIDYINSASEADTVLAHLYRREIIDYVASFDLDFLARGVKVLIPSSIAAVPGQAWTLLDPVQIQTALGLTDHQFLDLCVLMGSDYTPTLPIVPWSIALRSLQRRMGLEEIWSRHTFSNWRRAGVEKKTVSEIALLRDARCILSGQLDRPESMIDSIKWGQRLRV